jgi:hypothetical protein
MSVKVDPKCEKKTFKSVSGITMEPPPLNYNMNLQFGRPKLYPVPPGSYDAKYGADGPTGENFLLSTPGTGYSRVWIHGGSSPLSSEGCILVGTHWAMKPFKPTWTRPGGVPLPEVESFPLLFGSAQKMGEMIKLYKDVEEFDKKCCSKTTIKVHISGGR